MIDELEGHLLILMMITDHVHMRGFRCQLGEGCPSRRHISGSNRSSSSGSAERLGEAGCLAGDLSQEHCTGLVGDGQVSVLSLLTEVNWYWLGSTVVACLCCVDSDAVGGEVVMVPASLLTAKRLDDTTTTKNRRHVMIY